MLKINIIPIKIGNYNKIKNSFLRATQIIRYLRINAIKKILKTRNL
jgi:hypothetical protein